MSFAKFSPPTTQLTPHYQCHETGERLDKEGSLVFACQPQDATDITPDMLCSVHKKFVNQIPKNKRSKKEAAASDKTRINFYKNSAKFERHGTYSDHDRYLMGSTESDVGKFIFSATILVARKHLPNSVQFLRSRDRRNMIRSDEEDFIKRPCGFGTRLVPYKKT